MISTLSHSSRRLKPDANTPLESNGGKYATIAGSASQDIGPPPDRDLFLRSKGKSINVVFDLKQFLDSTDAAKRFVEFRKSEKVYSQGNPTRGIKFIQKGAVKLSVVNEVGKVAVVAIVGPNEFFGEGCLVGQSVSMETATAIVPSSILFIEKRKMVRLLREERELSDRFIAHVLARKIRTEEDLIDQLSNSSEKRLARTLLLLARYGEEDGPQKVVTKMSQMMLAEMVGTTRSRVNLFMAKFKKLGFIEYDCDIRINPSLQSIFLRD
jgi:CRP/FNR family cyclic AMP-dependent transcriptional regulator